MARWAALVGQKGVGKSTEAWKLAQQFRARGMRIGGFVQAGRTDSLERRHYELRRLALDETIALAGPSSGVEKPGKLAFCSFEFIDEAFQTARSWMTEDAPQADVIVIDEVSKLEADGRGHHDAIARCFALDDTHVLILSIRADQLFYVVERFDLEDDALGVLELPTTDAERESFVETIMSGRTAART